MRYGPILNNAHQAHPLPRAANHLKLPSLSGRSHVQGGMEEEQLQCHLSSGSKGNQTQRTHTNTYRSMKNFMAAAFSSAFHILLHVSCLTGIPPAMMKLMYKGNTAQCMLQVGDSY